MNLDLLTAVGIGLGTLGIKPAAAPPALQPGLLIPVQEVVLLGAGPSAQAGDVVTFHFMVRTADGKELANTRKRGMPFTVRLDDENPFWLTAVQGLQAGGKARLRANSSLFFGKEGALPIVPPETDLVAELVLVKIKKPGPWQAQR